MVVCANGWHQRVPFLSDAVMAKVTDTRGNFRLYRSVLPVHVPRIAFNGYNSSLFSQLSCEIAALWIAGVMQGLMWRSINPDGTLTYTFVESVKASYPFYVLRLTGGLLYLVGMLIMLWNTIKTATAGRSVTVNIPAVAAHA